MSIETATEAPTFAPTVEPTIAPAELIDTEAPTSAPTVAPAVAPVTESPTAAPNVAPVTESPTTAPTVAPVTESPTTAPVIGPTTPAPATAAPTIAPTIAPVAATDAPSAAPAIAESDAPSRAPIPLSPTGTPVQIVRVTDYYISFVAPDATREPTQEEYDEMLVRISAYFVETFMALNDADTEFISVDSSNDFTLYGDAAGIPRPEFNIYMNFDFSNIIYTETSVVPTVAETFDIMRSSITQDFILNVVRTYTGTPFESTNEVFFAASEFIGPP
jgi:hypothetical protein